MYYNTFNVSYKLKRVSHVKFARKYSNCRMLENDKHTEDKHESQMKCTRVTRTISVVLCNVGIRFVAWWIWTSDYLQNNTMSKERDKSRKDTCFFLEFLIVLVLLQTEW